MEEVKPYRIVARLKNNRLWRAIIDKWPEVKTQADAARMLKMSPSEIGQLLNMTIWPAKKKKFEETEEINWLPIAEKIWLSLGQDPEYLFDPKYYGIKPLALLLEFKPSELKKVGLLSLPESDDPELSLTEISKILATLTPREEQILRMRFGIGSQDYFLSEIGEKFVLSKERVRHYEVKALRKLRYSLKQLKSYIK